MLLREILETISLVISIVSISILLIGVSIATWKFFVVTIRYRGENTKIKEMQKVRIALGSYILFGLEVLIVADIIETIARPDFKEMAILMGIVVIRISTSFFLNKEIEEAKRVTENE